MKLVADLDTISSNLGPLSTEIDSFSSAVSSFNSASINCPVEDISEILDSYKNSISEELNQLNTSSHEYTTLVEECCSEYRANEENNQTIDISIFNDMITNNKEATIDYNGSASSRLTNIPIAEFKGITGIANDLMQAVANKAANNSGGGYDNMCEAWAEIQWENATGITRQAKVSAYDAWQSWGVSTSMTDIPVGAMVYGSGSPTVDNYNNPYGHVAIYIGDGMVADQGGVTSIENWISWQNANCDGYVGYIGWGWQNGLDLTQT